MNDEFMRYLKENADNLILEDLTVKFNVSIPTVYRYAKIAGVKMKKNKNCEKYAKIKEMRADGKTYEEIGKAYGLSRQRVEQIVNDHN